MGHILRARGRGAGALESDLPPPKQVKPEAAGPVTSAEHAG